MVIEQRFFCADLSRQNGEKLHGTAPSADCWMLLEYYGAWGVKAPQDSELPDRVKDYLKSFLKTTPAQRFSFIKRQRASADRINFFLVRGQEREPKIYQFTLPAYEQLLDIDLAAFINDWPPEQAVTFGQPLFLVCVHGSHDKCCAKYGIPLYESLKESKAGTIWQSSHVGGDRFAANLTCFPHAVFYGRVERSDALRIINRYQDGFLDLRYYRGRGCYSKPVQAAEFFLRNETGLEGIRDLSLLDSSRVNEEAWRVRFTSTADERVHEMTVSSFKSGFRSYRECRAIEEREIENYQLCSYSVMPEP